MLIELTPVALALELTRGCLSSWEFGAYWAQLTESACLTSSCFDGCARKVWHGGETQANEQHDEDEATEESEPSSGDEDHALGQGDALALVAWTRACRQLPGVAELTARRASNRRPRRDRWR